MNTPQEISRVENSERSLGLPRYPLRLLLIPALVVVGELIATLISRTGPINYDCAYYLLCAGLLVDGKTPITDFVDILPPIIFYLSLPSYWLSQLINLPVSNCFTIITTACVCLSIIASIIVVRAAKDIEPVDWLAIGPLFSGFLLFNLIVGFHFGQREHLFVLALFPFVLIQWLRANAGRPPTIDRSVSVLTGLACAVAIYVKPQLLLIPLAVMLSLLSPRQRHRRFFEPEIVCLVGGIVFCFLVSFLIPGINSYYERWVPFLSNGYAAFFATDLSIILFFVSPDGHLIGSRILLVVLCLIAYATRRQSSLINPLLAWTVAGLIVYLIQGRGWSYQSIPFACGYFLLVCVVVSIAVTKLITLLEKKGVVKGVFIDSIVKQALPTAEDVQSNKLVRTASVVFLVFASVLIPTSFLIVRDSMANGKILPTLDSTIMAHSKPKDSIVILHTLLPHAHQVQLELGRRPGCRYIWCFPLRMTEYMKENQAIERQAEEAENLIVSEIKSDIQKSKPKLIIIESWADRTGFSLYKCLLAHGFLDTVSNSYDPLYREGGFAIYKLRESDYSQHTDGRQRND